jgi:flagellar biosynthesis/type III secretory pathway chaperone
VLPQVHPTADVSLVTEALVARSVVLRLKNVMDAEQQWFISREHALSMARVQMEASFLAEAQSCVQHKSELDCREEVLDQRAFAHLKEEEQLDELREHVAKLTAESDMLQDFLLTKEAAVVEQDEKNNQVLAATRDLEAAIAARDSVRGC